jgi:hypothetical protein
LPCRLRCRCAMMALTDLAQPSHVLDEPNMPCLSRFFQSPPPPAMPASSFTRLPAAPLVPCMPRLVVHLYPPQPARHLSRLRFFKVALGFQGSLGLLLLYARPIVPHCFLREQGGKKLTSDPHICPPFGNMRAILPYMGPRFLAKTRFSTENQWRAGKASTPYACIAILNSKGNGGLPTRRLEDPARGGNRQQPYLNLF